MHDQIKHLQIDARKRSPMKVQAVCRVSSTVEKARQKRKEGDTKPNHTTCDTIKPTKQEEGNGIEKYNTTNASSGKVMKS